LVAVHAAVANGVDRATLHLSDGAVGGCVLRELESVAVTARFRDDEQAQSAVHLGSFRIGTRKQHQHIAARSERAPGLHTVDDIAGSVVGAERWDRGDLDTGYVAA